MPPKPSVFPILLVNFIDSLGFSIVLPFLVVLVLKFGGNELSYGFLGATYSFFQMIGAPVLGRWSDKYGRKKILLLSEAGSCIAWVLFLVALYLPGKPLNLHSPALKVFLYTIPLFLLFIARAVDGITGGNISVANAYLADISAREDRKRNFGKLAASANIGFIIGPALAGILGATALGITLPVMVTVFVSLVCMLTIIFRLRNVTPKAPAATQAKTISSLTDALKLPYVAYFLALYFLIYLGFNFFYVAFPVYVVQQLHWNMLHLGIFFAALSALLVIVEGPVLSRLSSRISGARLVIAGNLLLAGAFAFFCSASDVLLYAGLVLFSVGNGIMWPSFLALISNATDDRYQGTIQGFAGSAGSLASITGLVAGAFLYKILGADIFFMATAFMIIIAITSARLVSIEKNTSG